MKLAIDAFLTFIFSLFHFINLQWPVHNLTLCSLALNLESSMCSYCHNNGVINNAYVMLNNNTIQDIKA